MTKVTLELSFTLGSHLKACYVGGQSVLRGMDWMGMDVRSIVRSRHYFDDETGVVIRSVDDSNFSDFVPQPGSPSLETREISNESSGFEDVLFTPGTVLKGAAVLNVQGIHEARLVVEALGRAVQSFSVSPALFPHLDHAGECELVRCKFSVDGQVVLVVETHPFPREEQCAAVKELNDWASSQL